jgi:hypothetical protein
MEQEYNNPITAVKARINPTIRTFDFLILINVSAITANIISRIVRMESLFA